MSAISVKCSYCKKSFLRPTGRANEGEKFGWNIYCSLQCLGKSKRNGKEHICSRQGCKNTFERTTSDLKGIKQLYCSRSCAAIVNNTKYPKNPGVTKICAFCRESFKSREKYCSKKCKDLANMIPQSDLLGEIKDFVIKNDRIPFKNELSHYSATRHRFGTWNKAVKIAGFDPNPVMFAHKHIAKDGHKCDSLSEKIIDDWLFARKIRHERSLLYPGNQGFKVDFKIKDYWIEFFGLAGDYKWYDELKRRKLELAKKFNLKVIELYPKDIFPENNLKNKLLHLK